jgi:hypothetical protein
LQQDAVNWLLWKKLLPEWFIFLKWPNSWRLPVLQTMPGATKHLLTHEEITETVQKSSSTFSKLLEIIISKIGEKL